MPGQPHGIKTAEADASVFILCFDSPSFVMSFFDGYKAAIDKKSRHYIEDIITEAKQTFSFPFRKKLTLLETPNLGGQQAIVNTLELLLIHLLRTEQHNVKPALKFIKDEQFAGEITKKICEYLQSKVYTGITITELCAAFNYSKSYLSRIFKQVTGVSVISYYNDLKIQEAKKLIKETDLSFESISDKLNFSDPRYFHMLFKKITNLTPKQYRNSVWT